MSTFINMQDVANQAIKQLLSSISYNGTNGLKSSFAFHKPGTRRIGFLGTMGTEIYYDRKKHVAVSLFLRRHGPAHLRVMSIEQIWSLLTKFISENFWYIAKELYSPSLEGGFDMHLSAASKAELAKLLLNSTVFNPAMELTLYPLLTIKVSAIYDSYIFKLFDPKDYGSSSIASETYAGQIVATHFPPITHDRLRKETPQSWLAIKSASIQVSNRNKAAILGAIKLAPQHRYRYMNSGRQIFGGKSTFNETNVSYGFGDAHTPPIMYDIVLTKDDHTWLDELRNIIEEKAVDSQRKLNALRYFYRAWFIDEDERFPTFFMAIDALCGHQGPGHNDAIVTALTPHLTTEYTAKRLKLLTTMRGDAAHGRAPEVLDSKEYQKYYEDYDEDPIKDLEKITATYLRAVIFGNKFREQPKPAPI